MNDDPGGFVDDNHWQDDEKMDRLYGFVRPEVSKVNEPDLRGLLRPTPTSDGLVTVAK